MSEVDRQLFTDAVSNAGDASQGRSPIGLPNDGRAAWVAALNACNRLSMPDMLVALDGVQREDRLKMTNTLMPRGVPGGVPELGKGADRIMFAMVAVDAREITDVGLPEDQVNDGREYLGCTRMDDDGVRRVINESLSRGSAGRPGDPCCGVVAAAWVDILVPQRRLPGGSLISNVAAAAHYMLARYHVCAAKAFPWEMKTVIDGYDEKKRLLISQGDRDLRGIALTGNRPFPPDFAIRKWAYKGADDGEADRVRCNSKARRPVFPDINGQEY